MEFSLFKGGTCFVSYVSSNLTAELQLQSQSLSRSVLPIIFGSLPTRLLLVLSNDGSALRNDGSALSNDGNALSNDGSALNNDGSALSNDGSSCTPR